MTQEGEPLSEDCANTADGWTARLDALMRERLRGEADGGHDLAHLRRVWRSCRLIAADEPADLLVLAASAYLHDLVNLPKNAPDRHLASRRSAAAASGLLREMAFPEDRLAPVAHAIEAHSFSAGIVPETAEARVLQDADRLDSLGALGIARTFYTAGLMGSRLFDADDPWARERPLDDRRFALDHFERKLLTLEATMTTEAGRRLAKARAQAMHTFLDQLRDELEG